MALGKAAGVDTMLAQTWDIDDAGSQIGAAATNTRLTVAAVWLPAGAIVKGHRNYNTAAGGTASVGSAVCILSSDGTTLTVRAGKFSAIGASNTGLQKNTYAASYTIPSDGVYYLGYFISSANAMPTLLEFVLTANTATDALDPEAIAGWARIYTLQGATIPSVGQTYTISGMVANSTNFPWQACFGTPA